MGGKTYHKVPEQVFPGLHPVKGGQPVAFFEELVEELGHLDHVLGTGVREQDVLGFQFDHLRGGDERLVPDVFEIPEFPHPFRGDSDLLRPNVRQGKVDHVEPDRAVLEDKEVFHGPEDPLLHGFDRPLPRDEPLHTLDHREAGIPDPEPLHDGRVFLFEIQAGDPGADRRHVTGGALGLRNFALAAGTAVDRFGMGSALTQVAERL